MNDETLGQRAKDIVDQLFEDDEYYFRGPVSIIAIDAIVRLAIEYAEERVAAYRTECEEHPLYLMLQLNAGDLPLRTGKYKRDENGDYVLEEQS